MGCFHRDIPYFLNFPIASFIAPIADLSARTAYIMILNPHKWSWASMQKVQANSTRTSHILLNEHNQIPRAAAIIPGTLNGEGDASKATNLGNRLRAILPCVTNHGGVSTPLNGPHKTLFCGLENINVL